MKIFCDEKKLASDEKKEFIFGFFQKNNPNPEPFLHANTLFHWLIAVVLSAQTTDARVNKILETGLKEIDSPQKVLDLGYEGFLLRIRTLGLAARKARYCVDLSAQLLKDHNGHVPTTRQVLMSLPGVGRKTANVVLSLLGQTAIAVDTHVFRVARRLGLSAGNNPLSVEKDLETLKEPFKKHLSSWLIVHGRTYCKARNPRCGVCPLRAVCDFGLAD